jgi:predicted nucleotidyltransferase
MQNSSFKCIISDLASIIVPAGLWRLALYIGNKNMIDEKSIFELRDRIASEFQPQRIVMFGSYANGTQAEHSDLDLLIIMKYVGSGLKKAVEILNRVKPRIPVDLIVKTPEEIRERIQANDFFLAEILDSGQVLYEAPHQ